MSRNAIVVWRRRVLRPARDRRGALDMRRLFGLALFFIAGSRMIGQQPAETSPALPPSVQLPPELARVLTDYEKGWRAGDGKALAELFAENGFVLPNGAPPVQGRDAIQRYYK